MATWGVVVLACTVLGCVVAATVVPPLPGQPSGALAVPRHRLVELIRRRVARAAPAVAAMRGRFHASSLLRRALPATLILLTLIAAPAADARNCTNGKPCGKTCIDVDDTCHVGTTATLPAPGLAPAPYAAPAGDLPDPRLTPGDVLTTDVARICAPGYSKTVRDVPGGLKNAVYREYGITRHAPYSYEIDHLISLELGGSNSIRNLWPESSVSEPVNAHVKDRLENRLHELVCSGRLGLAAAQRAEATNWIRAYTTYVGPLPTR